MELTDMPSEVLIMIIQKLDIVSIERLYNTCTRIRNIVCMHGVVTKGNISCSVMATANTLKQHFFKDIASNLLELNMSAILDLTKTTFMQALPKLKNLKILDISYTNLNILDLVIIHKKCPNLKDITINFSFGKYLNLSNETLLECQTTLQHFENVHFVGSVTYLLYSKLPLLLLEKAKLQNLKFTIAVCIPANYVVDQDWVDNAKFPHFHQFRVHLMWWNYRKAIPDIQNIHWNQFPVLCLLDLKKYEYIIILAKELDPHVYASPLFNQFFEDRFNVTVKNKLQPDIKFYGNVAVIVWNRDTTNFNKKFFDGLFEHLKPYFPCGFIMHRGLDSAPVPTNFDWFYTMPIIHVCENLKSRHSSKQRQGAQTLELQYDKTFINKKWVELTLEFKYPTNKAMALNDSSNYLRKLTFLSLIGFGRCTSDFFHVLFRCCHNLITLDVQTLPIAPCSTTICRSLPLTRSLKNFRLLDKRLDMKALFWSFSQCPTLENVNIVDQTELEYNELANPTIVIAKCNNLYSFYIEANITESTRIKTIQMFNKAKNTYVKPHINVTVQNVREPNEYSYDPYVDVFRINPIKPLKDNV